MIKDFHKVIGISLQELGSPVLRDMDSGTYATMHLLLTSFKHQLWVTESTEVSYDPKLGTVDGLAKVLGSENSQFDMVTLALEKRDDREKHSVTENIFKILNTVVPRFADKSYECEYSEKNRFLCISRIIENQDIDQHISTQIAPKQYCLQKFGEAKPLTLSVDAPGFLDSLRFIEDIQQANELAPGDIEIEIHAVGLNFRDLLVALGGLNQERMGKECAGIITRVGEATNFQVGDRVVAICNGGFVTYARCHYQCAAKLSDGMSFLEAASLPITFCTAYHALLEVAHPQAGESILIHSAAGGTGQAAIQIANYVGAEVFATVSSNEKKQLLIKTYNIPSHITNVSFCGERII